MNAKLYAVLALVAMVALPMNSSAVVLKRTCLYDNVDAVEVSGTASLQGPVSMGERAAESTGTGKLLLLNLGCGGDGSGEGGPNSPDDLIATWVNFVRETVDGADPPNPDIDPLDPDFAADTACSKVSDNHWYHAEAKCSWLCPSGAFVVVAAIGGTIGYPGKIEGDADCSEVECENPAGLACLDYGRNTGATKVAVCEGDNYGGGLVNVAVECIAFGCADCGQNPGIGLRHHIDAPGFDIGVAVPGDQLCMPVNGVPECLTVQPESITLFNGPEDYMPLGLRCHAGACLPVEF